MKILALETSLRQGSLALLAESGGTVTVVKQALLPSGERTAQSLLPEIQTLMTDCGWKPADVDIIAVTTGPGSFTGLRIGVTTAKVLAYATGASLVGVHTLAAIAVNLVGDAEPVWTIMDAQRGELFVARWAPATWDRLVEEPETHVLSFDSWCDALRPGDLIVGPPVDTLVDRLPQNLLIAEPEKRLPRASGVGQLGHRLWTLGRTTDPMQLVPNYFRKSAAEEKALDRKKDREPVQ